MKKKAMIGKNTIIAVVCVIIIIATAVALGIINKNKTEYENAVVTSAEQSIYSTSAKQPQSDIDISMTDEVKKLKDFIAENFVKISFEMKNQFAFEPFDTPEKASVNKISQLAFCHIFSGERALTDFEPLKNSVYRTATEVNIKSQLERMFENSDKIDVKKSSLYNAGEKKFEMWQPSYKTDVFARCNVKANGDLIELECKFYSDSQKTKLNSESTLSVKFFKGSAGVPACYRIVKFK